MKISTSTTDWVSQSAQFRMTPHLTDSNKHKNAYNSVNFPELGLKFVMVVAETQL